MSERARGRRRTLTVSTPQARDFGLAIGRFRVRSRTVAGVRVRVHTGQSSRDTRSIMRAATRSVRLLQRRLGPYDHWPMPEGDTIRYAAKRVAAALVGHEIRSIETPHPRHSRDRWPERVAALGQGEDNRTTYWCPRCQA